MLRNLIAFHPPPHRSSPSSLFCHHKFSDFFIPTRVRSHGSLNRQDDGSTNEGGTTNAKHQTALWESFLRGHWVGSLRHGRKLPFADNLCLAFVVPPRSLTRHLVYPKSPNKQTMCYERHQRACSPVLEPTKRKVQRPSTGAGLFEFIQ